MAEFNFDNSPTKTITVAPIEKSVTYEVPKDSKTSIKGDSVEIKLGMSVIAVVMPDVVVFDSNHMRIHEELVPSQKEENVDPRQTPPIA